MILIKSEIKEVGTTNDSSMVGQAMTISFSNPTTTEFITAGMIAWIVGQAGDGTLKEYMDKNADDVHQTVGALIANHCRKALDKEDLTPRDIIGLVEDGKLEHGVLELLSQITAAHEDPGYSDGLVWKQRDHDSKEAEELVEKYLPEVNKLIGDLPDKIKKNTFNKFKEDII